MSLAEETARTFTTRDRAILKDVIVTYLLSAEPVSSRTVAKHSEHGLSAASIRNVMADLEEAGFLHQPHTSAGRVPTPKAYHLYIESMMGPRPVPSKHRRYIREVLRGRDRDSEEMVTAASQLLSELSRQISIVRTPAVGETVFKRIELVPVSKTKVLCVVVSASGFVDNKLIRVKEPLAREELVRISNYLTSNFAGLTLRETRQRLLSMMAEERTRMDRMMATAIELARHGMDLRWDQEVLLEGTAEVLARPELADIDRVRCLFDTFSDKAKLAILLGECMKGTGVRVIIGEDSDLTSKLDFSLVTTTYQVGDQPLGALGVFGPSRMEYDRMIPLVHFLGEALSEALAETFSSDGER